MSETIYDLALARLEISRERVKSTANDLFSYLGQYEDDIAFADKFVNKPTEYGEEDLPTARRVIMNLERCTQGLETRTNRLVTQMNEAKEKATHDLFVGAAASKTKKESFTQLKDNIDKAVAASEQFKDEHFIAGLYQAFSNTNMVNIVTSPDGQGCSVEINPDRYAGRLSEWGKAVTQVRKQLKISVFRESDKKTKAGKPKRASPTALSYYWKNMIYLPAHAKDTSVETDYSYEDTMYARFEKLSHPAPYWELLDKGVLPLSSDIGGIPYPVPVKTGFIALAELEIKEAYEKNLKDLEKSSEDENRIMDDIVRDIRSNSSRVKQLVKDAEKAVKNLEEELDKNKKEKARRVIRATQEEITGARGLVRGQLRERIERINAASDTEFAMQLLTGKTRILFEQGREKINLGGNVRVRYKTLMRNVTELSEKFLAILRDIGIDVSEIEESVIAEVFDEEGF